MRLTKDERERAFGVFANHAGDTEESVAAAIEDRLEQMFKPGELIVGGPIHPQRDYRKELWVEVYLKSANMPASCADSAVKAFDEFFSEGGSK